MDLKTIPAFRVLRRTALALLAAPVLIPGPVEAATLTVQTVDAQTGEPVVGAFVMVGQGENTPFVGNIGTTDGTGTVTFEDDSLDEPRSATAGASGYGLTTLYKAALGSVTLRLYPSTFDPTFSGTLNELSGDVTNVANVSNDGNLDASVVLPGLTTETLAFFDPDPFFFENVPVSFPVVGEVFLPENVHIAPQVEFIFLVFEKEPWTLDVPGNRTSNIVALSGRADIDDLQSDPDLNAVTIREFGVNRNVALGSGSQVVNIDSDIDLNSTGLTANFGSVPAGAQLRVVSAAMVGSGVDEELLGFSTITPNIDDGTSWSVAGTNPTGDISDATIVMAGVYGDSSASATFDVGIFERGPLTVPSAVTFDSWMNVPALTQSGAALVWEDPTGSESPSPVWTRSTLGLQPVDPGDTSVQVTADWRIYAPASLGRIELPAIPPTAPGGLIHPDETAENDQLTWSWVAANNASESGEAMSNFMHEATHWTQGWIPLDLDPASSPGAALAEKVELRVFPTPSRGATTIRWATPAQGNAVTEAGIDLRIVGPDGRAVRRFGAQPQSGELVWDGQDSRNREVPAGVYWVVAQSGRQIVAREQIIRIR